MNDGTTIALIASGLWLAVLSMVCAALVREVAILKARLDLGLPRFSPGTDGPDIGSEILAEVRDVLPELDRGRVYLLIMSAVCASCRELVQELRRHQLQERVVALVPGNDPAMVASLIELFPPDIRIIRDPRAVALARVLRVQSTPFAVELEDGHVTGKAYLHDVSYLLNLIAARRKREDVHVAQGKTEVISGV